MGDETKSKKTKNKPLHIQSQSAIDKFFQTLKHVNVIANSDWTHVYGFFLFFRVYVDV